MDDLDLMLKYKQRSTTKILQLEREVKSLKQVRTNAESREDSVKSFNNQEEANA